MKPKRVVLWGLGDTFPKIWKFISKEEKDGYILVVGGIDKRKHSDFFPFPVLMPKDLNKICFDYIIICAEKYYWDIYEKAAQCKKEEQIIDGHIFMNEDFDFKKYEQQGRLGERVVGNIFSDCSYADKDREYWNQNIRVSMGKKSYIGQCCFVYGTSPARLQVGRYTSISHDIVMEFMHNLDHDYRRVTTYGLSHLNSKEIGVEFDEAPNIWIGSDVWIGRGTVIKGGVKIGDGAVVAAHSYVVKDIPSYAIVGGNPARLIGYRFNSETIQMLLRIKWWNWSSNKIEESINKFLDIHEFINTFCDIDSEGEV